MGSPGPVYPTHRRFRRTGIARKPVSHPAHRLSQQPDLEPCAKAGKPALVPSCP